MIAIFDYGAGNLRSVENTLAEVGCRYELVHDFFDGFANNVLGNVHVKVLYGRSNHHKIEAVFKCFARAMKYACSKDARLKNELPSTKGLL